MKMVRNAAGRMIPDEVDGRRLVPFGGAHAGRGCGRKAAPPVRAVVDYRDKVRSSLDEAIEACGIRDGMTVSFHHHLRDGDFVVGMVMDKLAARGLKDLTLAPSALFPVHEPLIRHIESGVVSHIEGSMNGPLGLACSRGAMRRACVLRSHGGRARALVSGEVPVDVAFIAAPACDEYGNMSGSCGPAACGSLGYAQVDARHAQVVVAVTDNLSPYPTAPASIEQTLVDYVVKVPTLGDPKKIVSTTTRITTDPVGLQIARYAARIIEVSGLLRDGFSFQTGSGGISLAVADQIRNAMRRDQIKGSFGCGGITGYFVDMLEEGLFQTLFDVQCFDLKAVESIGRNLNHVEISADMYANPFNAGAVVNRLDAVILGATEIDTRFNVNVNTESNGYLLHNTGGHSDTAAGAKLAIIVAPSIRGRLPIIRDEITTITTPGDTVDVIVTERGIAVNDRHEDLKRELLRCNLPVKEIGQIQQEITQITGCPRPLEFSDEVVGLIEYRDGSIIDVIRRIED